MAFIEEEEGYHRLGGLYHRLARLYHRLEAIHHRLEATYHRLVNFATWQME